MSENTDFTTKDDLPDSLSETLEGEAGGLLEWLTFVVGRDIASVRDLTPVELERLLGSLFDKWRTKKPTVVAVGVEWSDGTHSRQVVGKR